jgi:hypothetical protein
LHEVGFSGKYLFDVGPTEEMTVLIVGKHVGNSYFWGFGTGTMSLSSLNLAYSPFDGLFTGLGFDFFDQISNRYDYGHGNNKVWTFTVPKNSNPGSIDIWVNSLKNSSANSSNPVQSASSSELISIISEPKIAIGGAATPSEVNGSLLPFDAAAMLIYDRVLSDSEINSILTVLYSKYSIPYQQR